MAPTDTCIDIPTCADNLSVASQYVFWDDAHKTTKVHEIMADAIVGSLPEPGTAVLIVPALTGLLLLRRRRGARAEGLDRPVSPPLPAIA